MSSRMTTLLSTRRKCSELNSMIMMWKIYQFILYNQAPRLGIRGDYSLGFLKDSVCTVKYQWHAAWHWQCPVQVEWLSGCLWWGSRFVAWEEWVVLSNTQTTVLNLIADAQIKRLNLLSCVNLLLHIQEVCVHKHTFVSWIDNHFQQMLGDVYTGCKVLIDWNTPHQTSISPKYDRRL